MKYNLLSYSKSRIIMTRQRRARDLQPSAGSQAPPTSSAFHPLQAPPEPWPPSSAPSPHCSRPSANTSPATSDKLPASVKHVRRTHHQPTTSTHTASLSRQDQYPPPATILGPGPQPVQQATRCGRAPPRARTRPHRRSCARPSTCSTSSSHARLALLAVALLGLLSAATMALAHEHQQEARAEPLVLASSAPNSVVPVAAGQQQQAPNSNKQNSDANPSQNVILIKYANVTSTSAQRSQDAANENTLDANAGSQASLTKLNVFQLHNEPLSVSVIESKFSHSIELFDVSQNQLSTLSKDLFCPLSNEVRQLNISHNLLENFDCLGLISQAGQLCLSELKVLDMSHNLIKHLPATGVATLQNLEVLDLSHNLIESLDELALESLFKLTKLDLSFNHLQQLPQHIFRKSISMRHLNLRFNHLQTPINEAFLAGLDALEELNLSHNNISLVMDLAFVEKPNLTRVDVSHNHLTGLRQEALRVSPSGKFAPGSSSSGQPAAFKTRLLHNGQFVASYNARQQQPMIEFYLSSNPFVCDCHLEWMRKFQPMSATGRRTSARQQSGDYNYASLSSADQLVQFQNDQPTVIQQQATLSSSAAEQQQQASSSSSSSISSSENNNQQQSSQAPQQYHPKAPLAAPAASVGGQATYGRIADLDLIKCSPLFRRNSQLRARARQVAPPDASQQHHSHANQVHHPNNHLHQHQHHNQHHQQQQQHNHQHPLSSSGSPASTMIDLLTADASNFLCRYKSHCFALCHCCEFDACDCEMICPSGCNCYYDSTWQTNIIDCSANNFNTVPDSIPMDVSGLYLDGNNIDSLRPSNLIARKSLKTLYLNSSNLQFIANRTFNGLIELQTLYLNDNQLRSLAGYEFDPLAQLRALYLQSNRLDHIANETFINLRSLELLDLSNNRLTSISMDLFLTIGHHNIRLRQLSIAHNWWSCQCQSIQRFRQILRQKFLLTGGVSIADRNQLRCYYNSTTVGPLILDTPYQQASAQQSQSIFGSFPQLANGLNNNQLQNNNNRQQQQQQQQQQLTEINHCSEIVEDQPEWLLNVNPPIIPSAPINPTIGLDLANDFPMLPADQQQQQPLPNQMMGAQSNTNQPPQVIYQPPGGPMISEQPVSTGGYSQSGFDLFGNPSTAFDQQHMVPPPQPQPQAPSSGLSLSSMLFLFVLCCCVTVVAISILVLIRQHQQRFRHKKSSAASTTSGSSNSSLAAAISPPGLGATSKLHHHQHHHQQQALLHHQQAQHLIISPAMGANQQPPTPGLSGRALQQHPLSASSQSNIYAALVSPTTGSSTIVASGATSAASGIFQRHQQQQAANQLYSNSSSSASHHSSSGSNSAHHHQPMGPPNNGGAANNFNNNASHWQQQQIYGSGAQMQTPYGRHLGENPYAPASVAYSKTPLGYGASTMSAGHSLAGSLYGAAQVPSGGSPADWIRLPRVRQFVAKLVNKSLALGGLHKQTTRDELAALASEKIYDAFLSYDKRDEPFVMQHLAAELEYGQPQYRVADRYRDLPLPSSEYMAEAISSVIGCSHRTIVVLTDNYLANEWCRFELQAALREAALDKAHKLIAVVLDPKCLLDLDPEMRHLLTTGAVCAPAHAAAQLVQLEGGAEPPQHQVVATLLSQSGGNQQVSSHAAQLATNRIAFINFNERKFWPKIRQMMPLARPAGHQQPLTLTTKN